MPQPAAVTDAPEPGQPGELRIAGPTNLQANDFIAVDVGPATPFGFLGQITNVQSDGNQTVLSTIPTTLPEAIPSGSIAAQIDSPEQQAESVHGTRARVPLKCGIDKPLEISDPTPTIAHSISFNADWNWRSGVRSVELVGDVTMSSALSITAQAGADCQIPSTPIARLPSRPVTFFVGPVPVVLTPNVVVNFDASGSASAQLTTGATVAARQTAGLRWTPQGTSPISSFTPSFEYTSPTIAGKARVQAAIVPTVNVLVYGVGGPELSMRAGPDLQADTNLTPWWTLTAPVKLTAQLVVPTLNVSTPRVTVLERIFSIAQATTPSPGTGTGTGGGSGDGEGGTDPGDGGGDPGGGGSGEGGITHLVSRSSDGEHGDSDSRNSSLSADGRYVAFDSYASNLVPGDANGTHDVFVHDRSTGDVERVSVATDGEEAKGGSMTPSISADGQFVAFTSDASNLVADDTNQTEDVFVHDRATGITERVSLTSDGEQGTDYYGSGVPSLSGDGRYVAFESRAKNLVSDDLNDESDVFVRDRATDETDLVSVSEDGDGSNGASFDPAISADGQVVAFVTQASDLVSTDGNTASDVVVRDRSTGVTELASAGDAGEPQALAPAISANGRVVAFEGGTYSDPSSDDLPKIFAYDRPTSETELVSVDEAGQPADWYSYNPSVSADGDVIAFGSGAALVADDANNSDVYVRTRSTDEIERITVDIAGSSSEGAATNPSISAAGSVIAFDSARSSLVADDDNDAVDVFVHDRMGP